VCWVVEAALASGLDGVLVVIGDHGPQVCQLLPDNARLEVLVNPRPQDGMGVSLALAASRARDLGAAGLVTVLGDMPFVAPQAIAQIAEAAESSPAGAAVGSIKGKKNHPVAFTSRHFAELCALGGDKGARDLLNILGEGVALVEVAPESRLDIDRPEDLIRALEIWKEVQINKD
jgi:molybdenum cofactor cytidylyltransferase